MIVNNSFIWLLKLDYFKFRTAIYNINSNNSMYKVDYLRIKYITKRLK